MAVSRGSAVLMKKTKAVWIRVGVGLSALAMKLLRGVTARWL